MYLSGGILPMVSANIGTFGSLKTVDDDSN